MAQRIVRVLCPHCSEPASPDPELPSQALARAAEGGLDLASPPGDYRRAGRGQTTIEEVLRGLAGT
jgi:type II secretory ATPase GspE/PulE/Tfp pilus assembly ATPase PilB-like protein